MTRRGRAQQPEEAGQAPDDNLDKLDELRSRIEEGDLDVEMIADYIMFCELGGHPDELMTEKIRLAMDFIRASIRAQQRDISSPASPVQSPSTPSQFHATPSPTEPSFSSPLSNQSPPPIDLPSPAVDGTAVRDIAMTISSLVGNMAIEYWKFKSYREENRVAENRLRTIQEQNDSRQRAFQADQEATRTRMDAQQSSAMWAQLSIWSLTAAAKFWTDYSVGAMDQQHGRTMGQFQAIRLLDQENRRSERFDQFLLWGGKAALEVGSQLLLKN